MKKGHSAEALQEQKVFLSNLMEEIYIHMQKDQRQLKNLICIRGANFLLCNPEKYKWERTLICILDLWAANYKNATHKNSVTSCTFEIREKNGIFLSMSNI